MELALSLLANSCTEAGSRVQVRELEGIPALVCILKSVCIDSIWNRVSRALGNLAVDSQNSIIIHESGAVSSLVQILQSSHDVGCLQSCLRALRILGDSLPHRLSICQQGGLAPCVQMLSSPDPDVVSTAVRTICELSRGCSLDCAEQLSPAVPTLMSLASEGQVKTAVRQAAFGTLCNLCNQGALRPVLGNAGIIKLLITEAMSVQEAPTRCLPLVRALCFCCREAVNRLRVRELGGLELLLGLLRRPQYLSVHHRITVAFLHYCHDTAAMSLLGLGGLAPLLAERLEEVSWTAEERGCVHHMREGPDEEEDKGSTSFDFPPEPRNKKEQGGSSEQNLRSWLLSEGYINSLEDLPPEWIMDQENKEGSTKTMFSPQRKDSQMTKLSEKKAQMPHMSVQICFSSTTNESCQSPIQEIFASPTLFGPRSPLPTEGYGPEFPVLLLLSRFSQLSDPSSSLVSHPVLKGLLTYVTCHPNPSTRASRLLQRLTCDPLCLEAFIRTGSICTLRARLLLHQSPDGNTKERSRYPERARELGHILLRNLSIQAESPFGVGLVTHMLVSGPPSDRQQCALCLPFIYRKDSLQRQHLLDGAIRLVLELLMLSTDPVYFFHASECLSSILAAPQASESPSSTLAAPHASECLSSTLAAPQASESPSSTLAAPQALEGLSSILAAPQASESPSSTLAAPHASECLSSTLAAPHASEGLSSTLAAPQASECLSSTLAAPQASECLSSTLAAPQASESSSSTLAAPHASECLSSTLAAPHASECLSSTLAAPQALEGLSSILAAPQASESPSSTLAAPQASEGLSSTLAAPHASECLSSTLAAPRASEGLSSTLANQASPAPPTSSSLTSTTCCYLELFSKGQGDIIFVLDGGERLQGSRELVSKCCEVFCAMLQGGYAESQQREVRVREVPICAFLPLLHYLHGCSKDSLCPTLERLQQMEPDQELIKSPLASTLAVAGRFLLPGLQCVLENIVRDSLLTLDNLPSVYNFAELHSSVQLRKDCCIYLLKRLHPPLSRAHTLLKLCEQAQDKQQLFQHLEDVLHGRD